MSTQAAQVISISSALLGAGGIAGISILDVPQWKSQPADRSLPLVRWLFSRGSHIFPHSGTISSIGFFYLAYNSLPQNLRTVTQLLKTTNGQRVNGYLAAALLAFSLYPVTRFIMVPNNFALMKKNEEKGGARSAESAKAVKEQGFEPGQRSAEDSVHSKGEASQFTDLSGPQSKTNNSATKAEEKEVQEMLDKFAVQNLWRAFFLGLGGVIGLATALS